MISKGKKLKLSVMALKSASDGHYNSFCQLHIDVFFFLYLIYIFHKVARDEINKQNRNSFYKYQ